MGALVTFRDFRRGPAAGLCWRMGVDIQPCRTWREFTDAMVFKADRAAFMEAARDLDNVASTGERAVVHAILHAADFAAQADEFAQGRTWWRLSCTTGDHAAAVAASILRID